MRNLKPTLLILSRSANFWIASRCGRLRSRSSILAFWPFGIEPAAISASICLITDGRADPPNFSLNFTPFHIYGLWLEVMATPPAAPQCLVQYEIAGVGV